MSEEHRFSSRWANISVNRRLIVLNQRSFPALSKSSFKKVSIIHARRDNLDQLASGCLIRSTVETGRNSSRRCSPSPSLTRTVKIVGRLAKTFALGLVLGGGGGNRMGSQPSVFRMNSPLRSVRFTTGKSVQFSM